MGIATKQTANQAADDVLRLPADLPEFPVDAFSQGVNYAQRAKSIEEWNAENQRWWRRVNAKLVDNLQGNATVINQGGGAAFRALKVTVDELTARVDELNEAIVTADQAFARRIVTVSAIASKSSNITVQSTPPGSPLVNDYWVDTSDLLNPITYFWSGTDWVEQTTQLSVAAVSEEASARVTADGFLSGKYTLAVISGDIVTGMNITSSTGSGTPISSVTFRATDFKIYNGVTGVTMFTVSGSTVNLAGTLTVSTAGKVYIGVGNYANSDTKWYVDSVGKFSLGDQLSWDGTTLSISGGAVTTVDYTTQVTGKPAFLTDGRIPAAVNSAGLVVSGVTPGINVTTGGAGLYLGADFLGYYSGSAWATYMDASGNFYLGGTGGALQWNGTNLLITGSFTVTGGNAAKVDFSNVTANYAGSPGVAGAANTIVSQGALATLNSAAWGTQVSGRPTELTDGRIPTAINSAGVIVSGVKPGIVVSASGIAGLYLGSDFLGYYNGSAWRTYMDNSGNFYLGGTAGALQWNGSTLTITGSVTITGGNAAKIDFSNVTAGYAGSPTVGGAANTIVSQGALATLSAAAWGSQVSGRPTELTDGRIPTAINSAGLVVSGVKPGIVVTTGGVAGLYLGSDFLGYYNGSAWRTYMDNSGNFYLGGTGGALQWNGTTLTIVGSGTFSGALSAATGSFAGSLSAATGTFAGNLSAAGGSFTGSLSGATGTFSGALSAATGTFAGSIDIGTGASRTQITSSGITFGDATAYASMTSSGGVVLFQQFNTSSGALTQIDTFGGMIAVLATTRGAFTTRLVGDSNGRVALESGGRIKWSDGSATSDVFLYRDSAGVLKTDGDFVSSSITMGGDTILTRWSAGRFNMNGALRLNGNIDLNGGSVYANTVNCNGIDCTSINTNGYDVTLGAGNLIGSGRIDFGSSLGSNFAFGCGRAPTAGAFVGYLNLIAPDGTALNVPFYS